MRNEQLTPETIEAAYSRLNPKQEHVVAYLATVAEKRIPTDIELMWCSGHKGLARTAPERNFWRFLNDLQQTRLVLRQDSGLRLVSDVRYWFTEELGKIESTEGLKSAYPFLEEHVGAYLTEDFERERKKLMIGTIDVLSSLTQNNIHSATDIFDLVSRARIGASVLEQLGIDFYRTRVIEDFQSDSITSGQSDRRRINSDAVNKIKDRAVALQKLSDVKSIFGYTSDSPYMVDLIPECKRSQSLAEQIKEGVDGEGNIDVLKLQVPSLYELAAL